MSDKVNEVENSCKEYQGEIKIDLTNMIYFSGASLYHRLYIWNHLRAWQADIFDMQKFLFRRTSY